MRTQLNTVLILFALLLFSIGKLYSQAPEYDEPILGEVVRELPPLLAEENPEDGSIGFYEILRLNIYQIQAYQAIELELKAENNTELPVSLVVYSDVKEAQEPDLHFLGNRLLTKGLVEQAQVYFNLAAQSTSSPITNLRLQEKDFPLYIVLYPFQKPNSEEPEQSTRYHYSVRFIKKKYGFVRFRLRTQPYSALSVQIDEQNYAWENMQKTEKWQTDIKQDSQSPEALSQLYQVGIGQHSVQVSNLNYYARNQFQVKPGELTTVDLQLKERLSQLTLIVPKGATILLDGIPLKGANHTPIWQNVEIIEVENFQHAMPRLKYKLTLPVGSHHLLLQYENKTWQREIYLEQGSKQIFELSWQLSSQLTQQFKEEEKNEPLRRNAQNQH